MTAHKRPLSPHIQIYRLPPTAFLSIVHRVAGVLLAAGLVVLIFGLLAVALGDSAYSNLQRFMGYWPIKLFYWGFVVAFCFHVCHGIRHLIWDVGETHHADTLHQYARYELMTALGLTTILFLMS